jgi:hypothetical protein
MMLFPIPDNSFWTDPGPFPFSQMMRRLWRGPLFAPKTEWLDQFSLFHRRLQREQEEWENYIEQVAAYEAMMAEYQEQGEHMAEFLPMYLHHLTLSYKRTVQDRKTERHYERVDYCEIETWYYDEYAYYFNVVTWPLPYGVYISHFMDPKIGETLSANFGSKTTCEFNERNHDRPGLWVIVEHKVGRGQVPLNVSYQQCLSEIPVKASSLAVPVGHGAHGRSYIIDLALITNLLAGGTQGGGKSNFLNNLLSTLISRNSPVDLRLFLVDFKRVEFAFYKGIKHLGGDTCFIKQSYLDKDGKEHNRIVKTVPADYQAKDEEEIHPPLGRHVVTEPDEVIPLLDYIIEEIERRTSLFEGKVRNIKSWNKRFPKRKLPYWFLVVDELADVMLQPKFGPKVEERLVRISQKGRAEGIGLILCTQTPNNRVVSLLIQQNIPTRVVFFCGTGIASGTMLDGGYEAARLPRIPGRALVREGQVLTEVQTPQISDWTVRAAVKVAKEDSIGQQLTINKYPHIDPEKVFRYALDSLQGYCPQNELYAYFKNQGVPQKEIFDILSDHEVIGDSLESMAPVIEINDEVYYLAPSEGGRISRQLIPVSQFESEHEAKWKEILAIRSLRLSKNGKTVGGQDFKTDHASQNDEYNQREKYFEQLEQTENQAKQTTDKPRIRLVDDSNNLTIRLPKGGRKLTPQAVKGEFPLAVVLDAKARKKWQAIKERLGTSDDTQAVLEFINNIREEDDNA